MSNNITPFLMFEGKAEEAMNLYISLFSHSSVIKLERYGVNDGEMAGKIKIAYFELNGREYMAIDSNVKHAFTFTPSFSLFVECETEKELTHFFNSLTKEGEVLMPLDHYGFSKKFAWVNDQFGISWQLNLS
ncbi:VOC family protein [Olivibacter domesticus]|uniref:Glyoxalase superfamily enzyme, possibly 3-demethylubiquinone-9 3-methyltransferase n=1 Tax=Olivibacter domesticus TaxID=407022 RepID=A0A1H7J3N5_OLID1|nr:VOC family protein [Olivibacter domesticus]SEK68792.1 Glyoxalase superfamily enzyme, possibly 3-demethylubiquinone-9 3-methyltransferase [Olivibacter domesticus]